MTFGFEVYESGNTVFSRSQRYPRRLQGTPRFVQSTAPDGYYFIVANPPSNSKILVYAAGGSGELDGTTWLYYYVEVNRLKSWLYGNKLVFGDWDDYDGEVSHGISGSLPSPTLDTSTGPSGGTYPGVTDPNTYGAPGPILPWIVRYDKPGEYLHVIAYG